MRAHCFWPLWNPWKERESSRQPSWRLVLVSRCLAPDWLKTQLVGCDWFRKRDVTQVIFSDFKNKYSQNYNKHVIFESRLCRENLKKKKEAIWCNPWCFANPLQRNGLLSFRPEIGFFSSLVAIPVFIHDCIIPRIAASFHWTRQQNCHITQFLNTDDQPGNILK